MNPETLERLRLHLERTEVLWRDGGLVQTRLVSAAGGGIAVDTANGSVIHASPTFLLNPSVLLDLTYMRERTWLRVHGDAEVIVVGGTHVYRRVDLTDPINNHLNAEAGGWWVYALDDIRT